MCKTERSLRRAQATQRGISSVEILAAIALMAIGALFIPSMSETVQRQRSAAVTRLLAGEIRQAQSRAVSTGWEYRIQGFPNAATNGRANQFRLVGRSSSAQPWPNVLDPTTSTTTAFLGIWTNLAVDAPGIQLNPSQAGGDTFYLTFDSRGAVIDRKNFTSFQVAGAGENHSLQTMAVGTSGRVKVQ